MEDNIDAESAFLKKSLENPNNMAIYNLTFESINELKSDILDQIVTSVKLKQKLMDSLYAYRYIDNLNDLRDGSYLRWINVASKDIILNKGALFCNVVVNESGAGLVCKSIGPGRYFILKSIDEYIFFQKMSPQELMILTAIDKLSK